ncbi:MAG TPA: dienelactone hydrolase family protein [Thermoanaerobaculia bacterium]
MRKTIWVVITSFVLAAPVFGGQRITKETVNSAGTPRTYYIYVPEKSPEAKTVPLLLTFHGSGRNGRSLVEKWTRLADSNGFIVAGLDSTDTEYWAIPEDGPDTVKVVVDAVRARHPVDETRVYLFGHSAGAVFGMKLALMESEYFAAVAVHAGSFRQPDELAVIEQAKRKIPFKIIVGDQDAFFPLQSVNATTEALKSRGFTVDLEVVKRHDHSYYDRAKQFNEKAWDFLKDQKLTSPPNYIQYKFQ